MKKTKKNPDAQKKRSRHKVREVSPEVGRKTMVGKIFVEEVAFESGVKE